MTNLSANHFKLGRINKALSTVKQALKEFENILKSGRQLTIDELKVYSIAHLNYVSQLKFSGKSRAAKNVAQLAVEKLEELGIDPNDQIISKLKIECNMKLSRPQSHNPRKLNHFGASSNRRSKSKFSSYGEKSKRLRVKSAAKRPSTAVSKSMKKRESYWTGPPKLEGWVTGKSDLRSGVDLYPRYCLNEITAQKVLYVCDQFSHEIDKEVRSDRVTVGRVIKSKQRYGPYTQIAPRWEKKGGGNPILSKSKNYQLKGVRLFGGKNFYRMKPKKWNTIKRIKNYDKVIGYSSKTGEKDLETGEEDIELLDESWEEDFENVNFHKQPELEHNHHSRKEFVRGLEKVNKEEVEKIKDDIDQKRQEILDKREKLRKEREMKSKKRQESKKRMKVMKEIREKEIELEIEQVEELRNSLKSIKGMKKVGRDLKKGVKKFRKSKVYEKRI